MRCFLLTIAAVLSACAFKFQTGTSVGTTRGSNVGARSLDTSFPIAVDAPVELRSEHGEAPGSQAVAFCRWTRAEVSKAHIGGGKYGAMQLAFGYAFAEDVKGPCSELEAKAKSDGGVQTLAQKAARCQAPNCVRAGEWSSDDWQVETSAEGNPVRMVRPAQVLLVVRPAGTTQAVAPLPEPILTSSEMKQRLANACRFPPSRTSCAVESASVHHVVHFFDDDGAGKPPEYEVLADVKVNLGGTVGTCQMRIVVGNFQGPSGLSVAGAAPTQRLADGQCRTGTAANASVWDDRCFTSKCVETTAQVLQAQR